MREGNMTKSRQAREYTEVQNQQVCTSREMFWLEELARAGVFNNDQEAVKSLEVPKKTPRIKLKSP